MQNLLCLPKKIYYINYIKIMFIVELTPELLGLENKIGSYAKLKQTISVRGIIWNDKNQIVVLHAK